MMMAKTQLKHKESGCNVGHATSDENKAQRHTHHGCPAFGKSQWNRHKDISYSRTLLHIRNKPQTIEWDPKATMLEMRSAQSIHLTGFIDEHPHLIASMWTYRNATSSLLKN